MENKLKIGFFDFAFVPSLVYIEVSDKMLKVFIEGNLLL
jgi:hypothetical protein